MESTGGAGSPAPEEGAAPLQAPVGTPVEPSPTPSITIVDHEEETAPAAPPPEKKESAKAPAKKPAKGPGRGFSLSWFWTGRWRVPKTIGLVIIILLASLGGYVLYLQSRTGLQTLVVSYATDSDDGLEIYVTTSSLGAGDYSGTGDVSIYYTAGDGRELTYTGKISIKGEGTVVVPYEEFIIAPGNYDVVVEADGKKDTTIYSCNRLVTGIYWWYGGKYVSKDNDTTNGTRVFRLLGTNAVWVNDSVGRMIECTILFNGTAGALPGTTLEIRTQLENATADISIWDVGGQTTFHEYLDYDGPGNYTMHVTLTNPVKEGSEYRIIDDELPEPVLLNVAPLVDAGGDKQAKREGVPPKATVHFSGTADDEDTFEDEDFLWYFPDDNSTERGREVDHDYYEDGNYWVRLTVVDRFGYAGEETINVTIS
ncbi:MAG TPA: PKD domain-containing protein [Thermoplasmata archaeon]|nr:PKD domain-containing protein [Thermoplasmata archaeon]